MKVAFHFCAFAEVNSLFSIAIVVRGADNLDELLPVPRVLQFLLHLTLSIVVFK